MNTANPLDQLPPLMLPEAPGLWPLALGWWVLGIVIMVSFIAIYRWLLKDYRSKARKRAAIKEAGQLIENYRSCANAQQYLLDCNKLLRRFCVQQFPTLGIAPLHGQAWLAQLDKLAGQTLFNTDSGRLLLDIYSTQAAAAAPEKIIALHKVVEHWLGSVKTATINQGSQPV